MAPMAGGTRSKARTAPVVLIPRLAVALFLPVLALALVELVGGDAPAWLALVAVIGAVASCGIVGFLVAHRGRREGENPLRTLGRALWAAVHWLFRMAP